MSAFEVAGVVIGTLALVVNAVAVFLGLRQLRFVREQLQQSGHTTALDHSRRRAQGAIDFYSATLATRAQFRSALPLDRDAQGVAEVVERSRTDEALMKDLIGYLGMWELFATAANTGVTDRDVVNLVGGSRIKAISANYASFMDWRRTVTNTPTLYCEICKLAEDLPPPDESRRRLAQALELER